MRGDDRRDRFDVFETCAEVHDARAQGVTSVNHGVRDEDLSAVLQGVEDRRVQCVEIRGDSRFVLREGEIGRYIAERTNGGASPRRGRMGGGIRILRRVRISSDLWTIFRPGQISKSER